MSDKSESAQALVPIVDQVIELVEGLDSVISDNTGYQAKIAELKQSLQKLQADQEKVVLEKVAKAKADFFDKAAMNTMLDQLVGLNVISEENREKIARRIIDDPNFVFPLTTKVAVASMTAPGEGGGIEADKEAASGDPEKDLDGWVAMAQGRTVSVKR